MLVIPFLVCREEIVVNLDDDKGTTFGALRQGTRHFLIGKLIDLLFILANKQKYYGKH